MNCEASRVQEVKANIDNPLSIREVTTYIRSWSGFSEPRIVTQNRVACSIMNSRQTTHAFNTSFAAVICHVRGISPAFFHRIRQSNLFRKRHQLRSHKQNLTSFLAIDKGDPHDHQDDNLNLNKQDHRDAS